MPILKNPFVNVDFSKDPELLDALDDMVMEDDTDRSKFIRKLVRQELSRRQGESNPPEDFKRKTNPRMRQTAIAA